jgi:hypothetical protein
MRAPSRTFAPSIPLRWTRRDTLSFPRNEGVPGSSPGVGFPNQAAFRARRVCQHGMCQASSALRPRSELWNGTRRRSSHAGRSGSCSRSAFRPATRVGQFSSCGVRVKLRSNASAAAASVRSCIRSSFVEEAFERRALVGVQCVDVEALCGPGSGEGEVEAGSGLWREGKRLQPVEDRAFECFQVAQDRWLAPSADDSIRVEVRIGAAAAP